MLVLFFCLFFYIDTQTLLSCFEMQGAVLFSSSIPSFLLFFPFPSAGAIGFLIFSGQIGYDCDRPLPNVYSHFVTQLLLTKELVEPACVYFDSEMKYPPDELCVHSSEA